MQKNYSSTGFLAQLLYVHHKTLGYVISLQKMLSLILVLVLVQVAMLLS